LSGWTGYACRTLLAKLLRRFTTFGSVVGTGAHHRDDLSACHLCIKRVPLDLDGPSLRREDDQAGIGVRHGVAPTVRRQFRSDRHEHPITCFLFLGFLVCRSDYLENRATLLRVVLRRARSVELFAD